MIYTIGRTSSYERYFIDYPILQKKGRTTTYEGVSVWRTREDAQVYCPAEYSVYGVDADWELDTVDNDKEGWHDLLRDAELIKLEEQCSTNFSAG